ncbi:hypothetical protein V1499_13165 [Neobacillus sp. SCS-31]|uniref:hypothetical protein n=1 Tax=Neobacillus oceani TaxID=3115292 RepID=UPI0039066E1F
MLKKILKLLLGYKKPKKYMSSSDAWKYMKHKKHSHYGHSHYKKKFKGKSFSSFFSS